MVRAQCKVGWDKYRPAIQGADAFRCCKCLDDSRTHKASREMRPHTRFEPVKRFLICGEEPADDTATRNSRNHFDLIQKFEVMKSTQAAEVKCNRP